MAFRGTFDHTFDAKNRLTVPVKFRASLSDGVVVAKGVERCVSVWTPDEYDAFVESALGQLNPLSPEARDLQRYFSANAVETELDSAGRIMVPAFLLDHGSLGKEVVLFKGRSKSCFHLIDVTERFLKFVHDLDAELGPITFHQKV